MRGEPMPSGRRIARPIVQYHAAVLAILCLGCSAVYADGFRLGSSVADHMVLQREKPVAIGPTQRSESRTLMRRRKVRDEAFMPAEPDPVTRH